MIEKLQLDYGEGFVLKAQDLRVQAGESIVIIGPSGGGKSTLLKCLAGLKQPTLWKASSTWESVRRSASLVSQKPFLFSGSVRDNLNYGLPARDDAELRDALAAVGLLGELEAGSQGLDTELDFVQSPLSGGQMQRLTVARGLLRPHALLLMDEVTSAIDPAAEEILTKHIVAEGRRQKRLLFYVTHRLSQLDLFDQIWFCEKGEVFVYASLKDAQNHERLRRFLSEHSEG